jgi:hypothetical protein
MPAGSVQAFQSALLEYPDEADRLRYAMQFHVRGRSVHADWRNQIDGDRLVGWTLTGIPGLSKDPVGVDEARSMSKASLSAFWKKLKDPTQRFLAVPKATQPRVWLDIKGKFDPGEVGATREKEGFIFPIDTGRVEFGVQMPDFHEYFLSGGKEFHGRLVVRLLPRAQVERGEQPAGTLGRRELIWMAFAPNEQQPFILSKRAVEEGIVPPQGVSALPESIKKKVPPRFRYWEEATEKKRQAVRDELVQAMAKGDGQINLQETSKFKWALQRRYFRGPMVVRTGASTETWDLRLLFPGEDRAHLWVLDQDPTRVARVSGVEGPRVAAESLDLKERVSIPPGTTLNPTKETPAFIVPIGSGIGTLYENRDDFKRLGFDGVMKGIWAFIRQGKTEQFDFVRSAGPGSPLNLPKK